MNNLLEAIQKGDADQVRSIIKADPGSVHSSDEHGLGCVSIAIYYQKPEIARMLIQHGAPVSFFEHCALGDLHEVQEELLQSPTLLDQFSVDGFQGLGLAAFFGQVEVTEYLIKAGAKVNTPSSNTMQGHPFTFCSGRPSHACQRDAARSGRKCKRHPTGWIHLPACCIREWPA